MSEAAYGVKISYLFLCCHAVGRLPRCSISPSSSFLSLSRHEFDSEQIPDLSRDVFRQDIHSVGSLCKLYFRELPNPLLTYQLYERFSVRTGNWGTELNLGIGSGAVIILVT